MCAVSDFDDVVDEAQEVNMLSWEFLWPRVLLLGASVLYGTNFPLGKLMNEGAPNSGHA